jgi:hypothetical protein
VPLLEEVALRGRLDNDSHGWRCRKIHVAVLSVIRLNLARIAEGVATETPVER